VLQQTQVPRVVDKYREFITRFPDFKSLARARLRTVLRAWQGLGYNRRALALKKLAGEVVRRHGGSLPRDHAALRALPGIGAATASSIRAFAFNEPDVFIETNIRAVFIHFFFRKSRDVKDSVILPLVEKTLDRSNPRRWYSALMDYGVVLKKLFPNPGRKSAHYHRQSPFKGSDRQLRGNILKLLLAEGSLGERALLAKLGASSPRCRTVLGAMLHEGLLRKQGAVFSIS